MFSIYLLESSSAVPVRQWRSEAEAVSEGASGSMSSLPEAENIKLQEKQEEETHVRQIGLCHRPLLRATI